MTNDNYIESIKSIVDAHHTQYGKFLRRPENKHLLEFIEQYESDKLKDKIGLTIKKDARWLFSPRLVNNI